MRSGEPGGERQVVVGDDAPVERPCPPSSRGTSAARSIVSIVIVTLTVAWSSRSARLAAPYVSAHAPHPVRRRPRGVPRRVPRVPRARGRAATTTAWEADGHRRPRAVRASPAPTASSAWRCPRSTAAAASRTSASTSSSPRSCSGPTSTRAGLGLTLHNDICLPYFLHLTNDEQKRALAAGHLRRRADHGRRHDRAGHRLRPGVDDDDGDPRRRPLRRQRLEDVHHQRHQRRPRHHRGEDRPVAAPPRHVAARARAGDGGLRAGPQPREDRHARPGHRRAVLHRRAGAGREPPRRGGRRASSSSSRNLPQERLSIAVTGVAAARAAFDWTLAYAKERQAFGQPIGSFQNSRFTLAEMATEIEIGQTLRRPLRRSPSTPAS